MVLKSKNRKIKQKKSKKAHKLLLTTIKSASIVGCLAFAGAAAGFSDASMALAFLFLAAILVVIPS
jgi:hypothetical protein